MKPHVKYGVTIDLNGHGVRAPVSVAGKRWSTPDKQRALEEMVTWAEKNPRLVVITVKKRQRAVVKEIWEGVVELYATREIGTYKKTLWRLRHDGGAGGQDVDASSWVASRAGKRVRLTLEELGEEGA